MGVLLYRNMLNREMGTFGKFLKDVYKNCMELNIPLTYIYSSHVQEYTGGINQGDTIIIVAHGSKEAIFHRYDHKNSNHQYLFKVDNLKKLNENKIIAISCGCARELGPKSIEQGNCKVFLGFMNSIHFDKKNGEYVSPYYENYVKKIYKETFREILELAIIENWTFEKLGNVLSWELRRAVMKQSEIELEQEGEEAYFDRGIDQAIIAINDVAANIKIFGESTATLR